MKPSIYRAILIISEENEKAGALTATLEAAGYEIIRSQSFKDIKKIILGAKPIIIISYIDHNSFRSFKPTSETIKIPIIIISENEEEAQKNLTNDLIILIAQESPQILLNKLLPFIKLGQALMISEDEKHESKMAAEIKEKELEARIRKLEAQNKQLLTLNREAPKELAHRSIQSDILPPFLKLSPEVIAITRISDGKIIDVNDAAERVTEYSREEALETSSLKVRLWVNLEDRQKMTEILLKDGRVHNFETKFRKKSGTIFPVILSACSIIFENDPCIITTFIDITEKRRAENLLKARVNLTEASTEGDSDSILKTALIEAEKLTDSHIGFFHLIDEKNYSIPLQKWSDGTKNVCGTGANSRHNPINEAGLWADCIRSRKPYIHNNYQAIPDKKGLPVGHVPILRVLTLPIFSGDEIVAIIGVGNKAWNYDEGDVKSLSDLSVMVYDLIIKIEAEKALKESEERFKAIFEYAAIGICQTNLEGKFVNFNKKFSDITGYCKDDLFGMRFIEITHPDDREENLEIFNKLLNSEINSFSFEKRYIHKKGHDVWVNISVAGIRQNDQKPEYFIATIEDITARKKAEYALEKERDFTSAILNTSGALIIVLNKFGKVVIFNRRCEELTGYSLDEVRGEKFWEHLILSEEEEGIRKVFENLGYGFFPNNYENHWKTKTGELRLIEWSNTCLLDENEEVTYIIGSGIDITEKRKTENALRENEAKLRKLNEELEHRVEDRTKELETAMLTAENANKAKSSFLANMSHELRTPLNAILGFSQLMTHDPDLSEKQRKNLSTINRSGEHLLQLINNVLDMAKIESGHTTVNPIFFDLMRLTEDISNMFKLPAMNKNIKFEVNLAKNLPRYISADEGKVRQILINILGNAVKFTEQGEVSLSVSMTTEPVSERIKEQTNNMNDVFYIRFIIDDTGAGMSKDELGVIFMPFLQTSSGQAKAEGTGLGLSISRQFAHLMGGDLFAESKGKGSGSVFTLEIPVQISETKKVTEREINDKHSLSTDVLGRLPGGKKHTILIAEDVEINRLLLCELLSHWEFDVRLAVNGREAVEAWQDFDPDLIFMDMRMPEMDGYEAIETIRSHSERRQPAIIALTASTFEEQKLIILGKGADSFLSKPYREREIAEQLEKFLGVRFIYDAAYESIYDTGSESDNTIDLSDMDRNWLTEMSAAVSDADAIEINRLAEIIKTDHPVIASIIQTCADNFDYEPVRKAVEAATGKN